VPVGDVDIYRDVLDPVPGQSRDGPVLADCDKIVTSPP
jgi:hypothetical protein